MQRCCVCPGRVTLVIRVYAEALLLIRVEPPCG